MATSLMNPGAATLAPVRRGWPAPLGQVIWSSLLWDPLTGAFQRMFTSDPDILTHCLTFPQMSLSQPFCPLQSKSFPILHSAAEKTFSQSCWALCEMTWSQFLLSLSDGLQWQSETRRISTVSEPVSSHRQKLLHFPFSLLCLVAQSCPSGLFVTSWTIACQASLSKGFPREEYWSGLPFPSPGGLPDPEIKLVSPALAGRFFTTSHPGKFSHCANTLVNGCSPWGEHYRVDLQCFWGFLISLALHPDWQAPEHHAVSPPALVRAVSSPETLLLIRPGPALRHPADMFSHVVSLEEPHLTPWVFSLRVLLPLFRQPGQWHAHRSLLLGVGGPADSHSAGAHVVEAVKEWAEAVLSSVCWPGLPALLPSQHLSPLHRKAGESGLGVTNC